MATPPCPRTWSPGWQPLRGGVSCLKTGHLTHSTDSTPIDGRFNLFSDKAKCRGVSAWVFVHLRTGRWSNYVIPWVFLAVSACGIPAETCDSSWISRRQGPKGHTCKANLVMSAWGGCATKQFQGIPRDWSMKAHPGSLVVSISSLFYPSHPSWWCKNPHGHINLLFWCLCDIWTISVSNLGLVDHKTSITEYQGAAAFAAVSPQTSTAPRFPILPTNRPTKATHDRGTHPDSGDLQLLSRFFFWFRFPQGNRPPSTIITIHAS